jgi:aerobic-type carbon monoxide dehydrogenase small subunit (CoxS/CutS family)
MTQISVRVDGAAYEDDVEPRTLLVHYLREQLGKVGTVVAATPATAVPAPSTSTARP